MKFKRSTFFVLLLTLLTLTLACRTAETIAQLRATPAVTRPRATRAPTRVPTRVSIVEGITADASPTAIVAITEAPAAPANPPAQPTSKPANTPKPAPPTRKPAVLPTPKPTNPPPPPSPTSQFKYRIQESRCGPNVRTYIEGYVYENNVAKNDVLVRISQGPDGLPDPNDDYRTGADPRKGYFFHNINANAPHGGTWYLWVIDPTTQQRISEIAIVKTDPQRVEDSENSSGSCQSASLKFSTSSPASGGGTQRTPTPSRTRDPNATPTPTQDALDDS
ncbi:MAG: hypothetical protein HY741_17800 [Chloroflexi bacterium]|nr:hypothetical protein [Chloroflexota bacterium]